MTDPISPLIGGGRLIILSSYFIKLIGSTRLDVIQFMRMRGTEVPIGRFAITVCGRIFSSIMYVIVYITNDL